MSCLSTVRFLTASGNNSEMLMNLASRASGHAPNSHSSPMTATTVNSDSIDGQCELPSFLKRKLANENEMPKHQPQHNSNNDTQTTTMRIYGSHDVDNDSSFKKRHIEQQPVTNSGNNISDTNYSNNQFAFTDFGEGSAVNSGNNNVSSDMTFNLIGSSTFMHDLFAYDANLMPPLTANLVTSGIAGDPIASSHNGYGASLVPVTSTTPTIASYVDEQNTGWEEASELLELDHRYTTGLQTDINLLNATVPLRDSAGGTSDTLNLQQQQQQQQQQQPQQQQKPTPYQTQNHSQSPQSMTASLDFLVQETDKPNCSRYNQGSYSARDTNMRYSQQNVTESVCNANATTIDSDFEDKNLSWLLNFKFDELPHLSPDVGGSNSQHNNNNNNNNNNASDLVSPLSTNSSTSSGKSTTCNTTAKSKITRLNQKAASKQFEELVMEVTAELDGSDLNLAERVVVEDNAMKIPKKPPFTYTELIEYALEDKGELTVSGIYQWISDRFPFYKSNDDRWKNSVRHNLSINPHFRKGVKAPQGAGHLWTISSGDSAENVLAWEHKKQRLELFFKMETLNRQRLQMHHLQLQQQQQQQQNEQCDSASPSHVCNVDDGGCGASNAASGAQLNDETAIATANIANEMLQTTTGEATDVQPAASIHTSTPTVDLPFNDLMSDDELRKTAGQILNGIHRDVQVQSVNSIISTYHDVLLDNGKWHLRVKHSEFPLLMKSLLTPKDYLNPINKDVSVHESGLQQTVQSQDSSHHQQQSHHSNNNENNNDNNSNYYITEIDPLELGIQMAHQEAVEEVLFNDDFNLNYFGYSSANDIVA